MQQPNFNWFIGIDYSGAALADSRSKALQVYMAQNNQFPPSKVVSFSSVDSPGLYRNWSRREIAEWIIEQVRNKEKLVIGIDHGFSFPGDYFWRYKLRNWDAFLDDFIAQWPTDEERYLDGKYMSDSRSGESNQLRLAEKWTSSAKSVFLFGVQGQVAQSTHSGLPWLRFIRQQVGTKLHFWPFDGFDIPEGKSVIAEVYPSIFKNRFPREGRTADEQDAYAVARWLWERDKAGFLMQYFSPPLTFEEQQLARLEGWILGIY